MRRVYNPCSIAQIQRCRIREPLGAREIQKGDGLCHRRGIILQFSYKVQGLHILPGSIPEQREQCNQRQRRACDQHPAPAAMIKQRTGHR